MRFEWDETKRKANIVKHGFDFVDAEEVFSQPIYTVKDARFDYGEVRFLTLGMLLGRIVAISHTESDEVTRVVSFRKADKNEQQIFIQYIANRLGKD